MHDNFADWYRPCLTGTEASLTEDLLQKRWAGILKLAKGPAPHALQIVRILLQKGSVPGEFISAFRAAFKEADATFQMSKNEFELSVLGGSLICHIMAEDCDEADTIALALVCATAVPAPPPWTMPFTACAHSYLDERLRTLRSASDVRRPQFSQKKMKSQIDAFVAGLSESSPVPISEAAKPMMESLVQSVASTTEAVSEAIAELEKQSRMRREETDILWWMTTGVSRDLGAPFKQLKTLAASVVAGKELASLVSPPGVLPAQALLQKVIPPLTGKGAGKPIGLIAAVNATERGWRQSVVDSFDIDRIADLSPALAAIKRSLTTDESDGWTAAYKKEFDLKGDILLQPADLGLQVHRECLLANLAKSQ